MKDINTKLFVEKYFKIKDKKANIISLKLNKPQQKLYDALKRQYEQGLPQRAIVLKARQMGFSTISEGIILKNTITRPNVKSGIVAHEEQATTNLFNMTKLYYDALPNILKPARLKSNAQELIFNNKDGTGLNSSIKCMTAGNKRIGRSDTFQQLHISEYAFWGGDKKETLTGLIQAVPNTRDSLIIIESTANGYDDFKQMWDDAVDGKSDFVPVFCAWWELDEYRLPCVDIVLTDEEKDLKALYNLDNEQIAWRRWCIRNNCRGDLQKFKQEYPACPEEAFISSGECVFDKEKIISQIENVRKNVYKKGYFSYEKIFNEIKNSENEVVDIEIAITNIKFVEDEQGYITIHSEPECKKKDGFITHKAPYVIGGDTAGVGSDYFTAKVINNLTQDTVATLHKERIDDDLYAEQLYCLGKLYNNALIGVETNYSRQPMRVLEQLYYPKLYMRERIDKINKTIEKVTGFETTSKTRPVIIAELVTLMRDQPSAEVDMQTLKEMLTFVKKPNGKKEAQDGSHDDLVMALAIAHFISSQQANEWIECELPPDTFLQDNFTQTEQYVDSFW